MSEKENISRKNKPGAGRKIGTGKFGEPTSVLRVPVGQRGIILNYLEAVRSAKNRGPVKDMPEVMLPANEPSIVKLDLYSTRIYAGLPAAAEDHVERRIDINSFLVEQEDGSFIAQVGSDSLKELGLIRNHYVVINRKRQAALGNVIAAVVDNEFTLKILSRTKDGRPLLKKANPDSQYKDIEIKEGMHFEIWGVVTGAFVKF
jgi:DNA polymerase V